MIAFVQWRHSLLTGLNKVQGPRGKGFTGPRPSLKISNTQAFLAKIFDMNVMNDRKPPITPTLSSVYVHIHTLFIYVYKCSRTHADYMYKQGECT